MRCADLPPLAAAGGIFIVLSVNFDGFPFLQQTSILIWRERSQSSVFITYLILDDFIYQIHHILLGTQMLWLALVSTKQQK